jgi:hypothetical protein
MDVDKLEVHTINLRRAQMHEFISWPIRYWGDTNIGVTIGHTFRHKSAGAFGPDLAKKLSQLVKMEKNVMRSMELVSRERMEVAVGV